MSIPGKRHLVLICGHPSYSTEINLQAHWERHINTVKGWLSDGGQSVSVRVIDNGLQPSIAVCPVSDCEIEPCINEGIVDPAIKEAKKCRAEALHTVQELCLYCGSASCRECRHAALTDP